MHRFFKLALVCEGWSLIAQAGRWNPLCSTHYYPKSPASSYSKSRWCIANEAVTVRGEGHRRDEDAPAAAVIAGQALRSFWLSTILSPLESVLFRDGVPGRICLATVLVAINKQTASEMKLMNEWVRERRCGLRERSFEDRRGGGGDPGASVWASGRV